MELPILWCTGNLPNDSILFEEKTCEPCVKKSLPRSGDVLVVEVTDASICYFNDTELNIGAGRIYILISMIPFTSIYITSNREYKIKQYLSTDILQLLHAPGLTSPFVLNFRMNETIYSYIDGMIDQVAAPMQTKFVGRNQHVYKTMNDYKGTVWSMDVQRLQRHPRIQEFCTDWMRDTVGLTNPPCIDFYVREDMIKAFRQWALEIAPDARFDIDRQKRRIAHEVRDDEAVLEQYHTVMDLINRFTETGLVTVGGAGVNINSKQGFGR